MTISVCVPTLNRYDLLEQLIESLRHSYVIPTDLWVIDNGLKWFPGDIVDWQDSFGIRHHYRSFGKNLGCAASWNWFIQNTSDIRIICNDDISFASEALSNLVAAYRTDAVMSPDSIIGSNSFSCFTMPDEVVEKVGLFDEAISPNYCWLEDNDYVRRMTLVGVSQAAAPNCLVTHGLSSTLKAYSPGETRAHHEKFRQAQLNYLLKWGALPPHEIYTEPYNGALAE